MARRDATRVGDAIVGPDGLLRSVRIQDHDQGSQAGRVGDPQPPVLTPYVGTHHPSTSPQDQRTPDMQDFASGRGLVVQDLRSPDARPDARPVQAPEVPSAGPGGLDWPSVGIGAALFGAVLLAAASIATGVRRTRTRAI
jgi:hypothetical protein